VKQATKAQLVSGVGAGVIKLLCTTVRFRMHDPAGFLRQQPPQRFIGIFWHNRQLVIPHMFTRYMHPRRAYALTSPSKDGEIVAAVLKRYGIGAIRGSSSRRGAIALREMVRTSAAGFEIAITPDGPRGPIYHLHPGVITLAQTTSLPVLPIAVHYARAWRLKSWDAFQIPKPFSGVDITLHPLVQVAAADGAESFEAERARLEQIMRDAHSHAP
jgi:lysophospholipid acyltransferase (LPLAT)-like uncharacterized protein